MVCFDPVYERHMMWVLCDMEVRGGGGEGGLEGVLCT